MSRGAFRVAAVTVVRRAHAPRPVALQAVKAMHGIERADHAIEAMTAHAQKLPTALRALLRFFGGAAHAPLDSAHADLSQPQRSLELGYRFRTGGRRMTYLE